MRCASEEAPPRQVDTNTPRPPQSSDAFTSRVRDALPPCLVTWCDPRNPTSTTCITPHAADAPAWQVDIPTASASRPGCAHHRSCPCAYDYLPITTRPILLPTHALRRSTIPCETQHTTSASARADTDATSFARAMYEVYLDRFHLGSHHRTEHTCVSVSEVRTPQIYTLETHSTPHKRTS